LNFLESLAGSFSAGSRLRVLDNLKSVNAALTKLAAAAGTAAAVMHFEHSRSWIEGSISCNDLN
jgi:hypothetical protein